MTEVETTYRTNRQYFERDSHAYLIFATFEDQKTSPEQFDHFKTRLLAFGLPIVSENAYKRSPSQLMDGTRPEGTVWVVKQQNQPPRVYLEDKIIRTHSTSWTARQTQGPSVHRETSSGQSAGRSQAYWTVMQGTGTYAQYGKTGNVLQRSSSPPENVPIQLHDSQGNYCATRTFDGERWLDV
ncbi:hypothetical protein BST61_g11020 [Cercospora zeina]